LGLSALCRALASANILARAYRMSKFEVLRGLNFSDWI